MDELLKALAEAVRAGTAYAMPALIGYYVVRVIEAITTVGAIIGTAVVICNTVRYGINRTCESDEKKEAVQLEADKAKYAR